MWSMQMSRNRLRRAQLAGKLLGVSTQVHPDVETEDWLFEMVLRLARRVNSLEDQLIRCQPVPDLRLEVDKPSEG